MEPFRADTACADTACMTCGSKLSPSTEAGTSLEPGLRWPIQLAAAAQGRWKAAEMEAVSLARSCWNEQWQASPTALQGVNA